MGIVLAAAAAILFGPSAAAAQQRADSVFVASTLNGTEGTTLPVTLRMNRSPNAADTISVTVTGSWSGIVTSVTPNPVQLHAGNWSSGATANFALTDDGTYHSATRSVSVSFLPVHTHVEGAYSTLVVADNDNLVASPTSVQTTEGAATTFGLRLQGRPSANVTASVTSGSPSVATVSPAAITFTPTNWSVAQRVTVTGVNNFIYEPSNRTATLTMTAAGGRSASVAVTVLDNDPPALWVSTSQVKVTEAAAGRTATYSVRLTAVPTSPVAVTPSSADPLAATVSGPLVFDSNNWDSPQTVTVTAVDDGAVGNTRTTTITHTASGGIYNLTGAGAVTVEVEDDDANPTAPGTLVANPNALRLTEAPGGRTGTYNLELSSVPSGNVTVTLSTDNPSTVKVEPATLTLTPANFTAHTVTVTAVDDAVHNATNRVATITHSATGGGVNLKDVTPVTVTVVDDEVHGGGVAVSPAAITVAEAGGTGTYTVRLNAAPTGQVTVTPASSDPGAAMVSGTLSFTSSNWFTPQRVTVTGVDDDVYNAGNRMATITHSAAGGGYSFTDVAPVAVTVTDDDAAGLVVSTSEVTVDEAGGTATYTVRLGTQPGTGDVTVTPASSDMSVATVSGAMTFTAANWNMAQTVTVTGVDDDMDNDPDRMATITHSATGGGYNLMGVNPVAVTATDDDVGGLMVSESAVTVSEAGGTATYTVTLAGMPSGDVTVTPASSDMSAATVSGSLTFTAANWNMAQTVTVTGVDDDVDNASDRMAMITHSAMGGGYNVTNASAVSVTVTDDDAAGLMVSESAVTVSEAGGTATYTVALATMPSGNVTVTTSSSDTDAATVSGAMTFTAQNWSTAQTVTVTGVDDDLINASDRMATITHSASGGGYNLMGANAVAVTVTDDDVPGLVVSPSAVTVSEAGGTANYAVMLATMPSGNVVVTPSSSNPSAATVGGALTFTTQNWNRNQTVTVTGVNDDVHSASGRTATITHAATGGGYSLSGAAPVSVTITDDDEPEPPSNGGMLVQAGLGGLATGLSRMNADVLGGGAPPGGSNVGGSGGSNAGLNLALGGRLAGAGDGVSGFVENAASLVAGGLASRGPRQAGEGDSAGPFGAVGGLGMLGQRPGAAFGPGGFGGAGFGGGVASDGFGSADWANGSSFRVDMQEEDQLGRRQGIGLWGLVRTHRFSRKPTMDYTADGSVSGYYAGTDYTTGSATLGVAVARHSSSVDFQGSMGSMLAMNSMGANLTTVMPYVRLSPRSGMSIWGMGGFGRGTADFGGMGESDLSLKTFAVGAASDLARAGALVFQLKADGYTTNVETDAAAGIPAQTIGTQRGRVALNTRAEVALSPTSMLVPSVEAGARFDRGDAENGTGIEMGGGLLLTNARLGLDFAATGRWLVSHSEEDLEDWGAGLLLRFGPRGTDQTGLSLSVGPSWGHASSRVDQLWSTNGSSMRGGFAGVPGMGGPPPGQFHLDVNYGIRAFGDGMVSLFSQSGVEAGAERFQVGTRFELPRAIRDRALGVELLGERMNTGIGARYLAGVNLVGGRGVGANDLIAPFAELRFEDAESRRMRVGALLGGIATDVGILGGGGAIDVSVFGEHVARRGEAAQNRVGISASYPRR